MIKKFFNLGFRSWRDRKLKGTYLRYYIENPQDDRNILARWFDFFGILLVFWALSFILLASITKTQKALLLSAVVLLVGLLITDIFKRRQLRKKILNTHRRLARESYVDEMARMEDDEFHSFATDLLQKYGIKFSNEPIQSDAKAVAGTFEQEPVLIKFLPAGTSIPPSGWEKVADKISKQDYTAGIIVTKEKVTNEMQQSIELYRHKVHIEILGKNRLAKLAAHIDHPASVSLPEEFSRLKQHQEKAKKRSLRKELIGTRQQTKGYAFLAGLLFVLFAFLESSALISLTYLVFAMLNTALAATSLIMEWSKKQVQLLRP